MDTTALPARATTDSTLFASGVRNSCWIARDETADATADIAPAAMRADPFKTPRREITLLDVAIAASASFAVARYPTPAASMNGRCASERPFMFLASIEIHLQSQSDGARIGPGKQCGCI
jgi:hypothetical protein